MTPSLQDLLLPGGLRRNLFPPTSRYHGIDTATWVSAPTPDDPEGRTIVYVRRRLLPSPDGFALVREHVVSDGERIDHIAATYLSDPEQYWRLCDANGAMHPKECEEVGRRLRITLPDGIPGDVDA